MRKSIWLAVLIVAVYPGLCFSDWPDWRGPDQNGRSDAADLPLTWSATENIAWKSEIHGSGYSTPVVLGDQIWLTTATDDGTQLYAVCLSLATGKIVHDLLILEPAKPERVNPLNSYATPSAVLEEGRAYVHFGTYGTAAIDSKTGEILWKRTDINVNHLQGPAASPVLFEDLLIVSLEGVDAQYTEALDKKTGETVWRTDRPRDVYDNIDPKFFYFAKAYVTPIIVEVDGKPQLVSNGSQVVNGYDPYTGEEIWRVVYDDDNTIARVVYGQGLFFVNCGGLPSRARLLAIREGGSGDVTDSHVVWDIKEGVGLEPSPVLADDLLYMVSESGVLTCLDAKTGEAVWSNRLRGKFGSSLVYGAGRVYLTTDKGLTTVVEHGRTYRVLAENDLGEERSWASMAVAGDSLLIRGATHLYRIQEQ